MQQIKSAIIALILVFSTIVLINAQQATIQELTGTVELQWSGTSEWENAMQGQNVAVNTVISTGFKSHALLSMGESLLNVRPLTRLSITELSTLTEAETINVNLQAGRVRANVNPPTGARAAFTVQTPSAVASVRGTIFEIDTVTLWVMEGSIEYRGKSGIPVIVDAGGFSYIMDDEKAGRAAFPRETLQTALKPDLPLGFEHYQSFGNATVPGIVNFDVITIIDFE